MEIGASVTCMYKATQLGGGDLLHGLITFSGELDQFSDIDEFHREGRIVCKHGS